MKFFKNKNTSIRSSQGYSDVAAPGAGVSDPAGARSTIELRPTFFDLEFRGGGRGGAVPRRATRIYINLSRLGIRAQISARRILVLRVGGAVRCEVKK